MSTSYLWLNSSASSTFPVFKKSSASSWQPRQQLLARPTSSILISSFPVTLLPLTSCNISMNTSKSRFSNLQCASVQLLSFGILRLFEIDPSYVALHKEWRESKKFQMKSCAMVNNRSGTTIDRDPYIHSRRPILDGCRRRRLR